MPIEYEGQITEDIFIKSHRLAMLSKKLLFTSLFPILVILVLIIRRPHWSIGDIIITLAIAIPLTGSILYVLQNYFWRRIYRRSPYLKERLSGAITEEAFSVKSSSGMSNLPWNHFVKTKIGKNIVLLYKSPVLVNILPREFFQTDDQWQEALAIIQKKIPTK